jgi:hypothetical protein
MQAGLQASIAFHLTGKIPAGELDPVDGLDLRPALFAEYRDLTRLRYDFPLVLVDGDTDAPVQSLCGLFDDALRVLAEVRWSPRAAAPSSRRCGPRRRGACRRTTTSTSRTASSGCAPPSRWTARWSIATADCRSGCFAMPGRRCTAARRSASTPRSAG